MSEGTSRKLDIAAIGVAFVLFVVVMVTPAARGDTPVHDYCWGTWDYAGSPYVLTGTVIVPKCDPLTTDYDGDGEWDDAEDYDDYGLDGIPGTGDYGEGNGRYDVGEPYTDENENGHWDPAEQYIDVDEDGFWTPSYPPLTVAPGVTVRSSYHTRDLQVYGRLEMNGAYLELTDYYSGDYSTLYVRDGGEAELNGCAISNGYARLYALSGGDLVLDGCTFDGGAVTYNAGSTGSVNACDGTNWYLTVSSDQVWLSDGLQLRQLTIDAAAVSSLSGLDLSQNLYLNTPMTISDSTIGSNVFMGAPSTLLNSSASRLYLDFESGAPVVQGCEFSNQYAIQIKDPDIDLSGISGNTYTHATPVVQISGTLDGVQTLGLLDGLDTYQLSTGLTIEAGADLTVSPGITLRSTNEDWDIQVYGRLEMNGAYLELTGLLQWRLLDAVCSGRWRGGTERLRDLERVRPALRVERWGSGAGWLHV